MRPRRWRLAAAPLALAVAVAAPAAAGLALSRPGGLPWPAGVAPIAAFIARDRGLAFLRPVPVHFVAPRAFDRSVAAQDRPRSAATVRADRLYDAELRALGLIGAEADVTTSAQAADESGGVLGYYTATDGSVYLRGATLTPGVAVTLAHELTHALQDQHFGLNRLARRVHTEGETFALSALEEGDAVLDQDDYENTLSPAARRQATATPSGTGDGPAATPTPTTTPPFFTITSDVPYVLGPDFVQALYAVGGNAGIDGAYRHLPTTELDILDPAAYLVHVAARALPPPPLGPGQSAQGTPQDFGAFFLYMTLADRLPAEQALAAADDWGGGEQAQYATGGRSCVTVDLVGRSATGTSAIGSALADWAAAGPAGQAVATATPGVDRLSACDPGEGAQAGPGTLEAALTLANARDILEDTALYAGARPGVAECAADRGLSVPGLRQAALHTTGRSESAAQHTVRDDVSRLIAACDAAGGQAPS